MKITKLHPNKIISTKLWSLRSLGKFQIIKSIAKYFFKAYYFRGRKLKISRGPLTGVKWKCIPEEQFYMPMGVYELETSEWLLNNLNLNAVFLDIGANSGYFTLLAASESLKKQINVISFEPSKVFYESVVEKVKLNEYTANVIVENKAIGHKLEKNAKFNLNKNGANSHLAEIKAPHLRNPENHLTTVEVTTVDHYCEKNKIIPTLIKIDIEGGEKNALLGMKNIMKNFHPKLLISTHSKKLEKECRDILFDANYSVKTLKGFEHELICTSKKIN